MKAFLATEKKGLPRNVAKCEVDRDLRYDR